ncbi:MAG: LTA synthase family protein [Lachnospiraceae bacterium]|nr:LTA synthase family protein [Lachnospiraceae bacterium]
MTRFKTSVPAVCFLFWTASLFYWESLLRVCISGGIRPGSLAMLVFLPAEALFLTVLTGIIRGHRVISGICDMLLCLVISFFYFAQLVYYRVTGSLLPIAMIGMGGQAAEDFGWTIRGTLISSLIYVPLLLLPVAVLGLLSLMRRTSRKDETKRPPLIRGYALLPRLLCLVLSVVLWVAGGLSLSLFGRGRDSAWHVYHSSLSDIDTSAERLGILAATVAGLYSGGSGQDTDLAETLASGIDMEALELPEKPPVEETVTAAPVPAASDKAEDEEPDIVEAEEEEPAPVYYPRLNEAIDFKALESVAEDDSIKALCNYFDSRKAYDTNEYTGIFEGYNLVWLCCEAFSAYGLDPDITPLMYKMSQNGIVLDNFYNSFPNITTNGEFSFDTSLWPDVSRSASNGKVVGSFPQSSGVFMPYGLGDLFTAEGVNCYAYHNYRGDYYMRDYSWPNLGYDRSRTKFMGQGMTFSSPWPASDLEMMEQSVDDFIEEDRFHAYYMTFSGHGPFDETNSMFRKNIDRVRELAGGRFENEYCLGYFCGEYELELALEYLTERLEDAGKLDKTVIVLIGDHFPYYLPDDAVKEFNGGSMPEGNERYRSSCIIYNAGMEEPVHCDTYCCNVDILPTILNLFDIDFDSRLLMGTDVFSNGIHRARMYNGSFVTKYVSYDITGGSRNWLPASEDMSEAEREAYINAMFDYTESEYKASLSMIDNDFYFYVWRNSGLLDDDEIEAEIARQEKGRVIYADREEADRIKAEEWERKKAEEEAAAAAAVAQEGEGEDAADPAEDAAPAGDGQAPGGQAN